MPTAAIIGAGLVGRSWSVVFARAGWNVSVSDPEVGRLDDARDAIMNSLRAENGRSAERAEELFENITFSPYLKSVVRDVSLIQECVPDVLELKKEVFSVLDGLVTEEAIICSSSSAIVPSLFTKDLVNRERCLVAHPVNPPHLAPIVELCGAPWTDKSVIARASALYRSVGQVPVVVHQEREGLVLNRLQSALLTEALRLVGEGVISARDLDLTVTEGLGLRWSFIGPIGSIELNAPGGIRDYVSRYGGAFRRIACEGPSPEAWDAENVERVAASWGPMASPDIFGEKSRWRDRRLSALRAHKEEQELIERGEHGPET